MEKKTIYQRLEDLFGPEKHKISKSRYSLDDKQLLKTQSKEEYEVAKLQAQQNKYLSSQWQKVDGELFQQSVYYETTRIASYSDFEGMEFYPEIAAALDIFMEEATCSNSEGRVLNIFSESKRVKRILQDLFFNRLDIHTSLPMWTRNTCKYGDNFLFLKIEDEKGIVGVKQLPNIEIERKEADNYRIYNANDPLVKEGKKDTVSFFWKNKDITFNSWQIGHFRLLGDDRRLPYGTSVLEKARRIWKQLLLSEDAMLVYRVTRAPERRIFKIYVGNIDEQDVPSYVQKIANNFKKTPVIDQRTGQIDTRYNQMAQDQDYFIPVRDPSAPSPIETLPGACIDLNTRIPLLDGRTLKLSEIINEWDNGNRDLWVYSCNPKTGEFVPGMITWAGVTRKDTDVMKITLDNGEEIIATPDHKFLHREGYKLECKDLKEGMSLMPFYRKNNHIKDNEMIFDHSINDWVLTHEKVSNFHKNIVQEKINSDSEYIESVNEFYNHKIVKIEYLVDKIDTGTITVDGNEIYHNFHTFAIESGIYIFNSNLSEIADIEYLQKKLFTALRVPKPFLGFEEANGDGKNLALQDIRFTRTINRIQQSMVQELNKIAIVHLYLLGLEDELENFTLSLNNPSTQADMLRTEQLAQKIQVYRDSVADAGNGFGAMSMTRAKRDILGMSEEEIRLDIEQQRLEKAAAAELANTSNVIKKTGIFDKIDRMYGEFGVTPEEAAKTAEGAEGGEEMGGMESSFGGGGSMSTPSTPTESPEEPEPTETPEPAAEGFNRSSDKLLTEEVNKRKFEEKMKKYKNIYTNRLLESLDRENEKLNKVSNIDKNKDFLNEEIDKISKFIDDVIKD
jgi:hypothetical protein